MAENYVLLETINLTQTTASVTFDNLPTTGYTDLKVVGSFRGTTAQVYEITHLRFNGLTTNLSSRSVEGTGSSSVSFTNSHIYFSSGVGASATSNTYSNAEAYIPNYRSSEYKSVSIDNNGENNAGLSYSQLTAGLWSSTAPITSIELAPTGSFVAGSTFSLYGLAATGTTPTFGPFATGGNIVANDGTYWYHAFLNSGTFTPLKALSCDALVVAGGGGGGGGGSGGGGGAGGVFVPTTQSLTATNYLVTIGAGGGSGANGNDSQFGSLTLAKGGGYGGGGVDGGAGGSGGGAYPGQIGGATTQTSTGGTGFGNAGGNGGAFTSPYTSGGGGGSGSAGAAGVNPTTGAGGAGKNTLPWSGGTLANALTATSLGVSGYIAGGGGGGANEQYTGGSAGAAGSGGGGTGGVSGSTGTAGVANTGSGGGGSSKQPSGAGTGASGGSGLVIIRYPMV